MNLALRLLWFQLKVCAVPEPAGVALVIGMALLIVAVMALIAYGLYSTATDPGFAPFSPSTRLPFRSLPCLSRV